MDKELIEKIDTIAHNLKSSRYNVALTGAGISVESGIPDFRSECGLWERFDPMEYATIDAFRANPEKVWQMLFEMSALIERAKPNPAHLALAQLERMGLLKAIITQNIDDLHQVAGSQEVIEFHGNARRLVCTCGANEDAATVSGRNLLDSKKPPRCTQCDRILKPDAVFFGEPIPQEASDRAMQAVEQAESLLVIGTSATVAPASYLPVVAKNRGATIIEINLTKTQLTDTIADFSIQAKASGVLEDLVQRLASP